MHAGRTTDGGIGLHPGQQQGPDALALMSGMNKKRVQIAIVAYAGKAHYLPPVVCQSHEQVKPFDQCLQVPRRSAHEAQSATSASV